MGDKKILKIFPSNLFKDEALKSLLVSLTDEDKVKPFECVGTREEIKIALYLSTEEARNEKLPELLKFAKEKILANENDLEKRVEKILRHWGDNNLDEEFKTLLKEYDQNI